MCGAILRAVRSPSPPKPKPEKPSKRAKKDQGPPLPPRVHQPIPLPEFELDDPWVERREFIERMYTIIKSQVFMTRNVVHVKVTADTADDLQHAVNWGCARVIGCEVTGGVTGVWGDMVEVWRFLLMQASEQSKP